MPEVSQEQINAYQSAVQLLRQLEGNPESRRNLERAIKVVRPEIETEEEVIQRNAKPYVEQLEATQKQLQELRDSLAERDKKAAESADAARVAQSLSWLDSQGYTEEGREAIKKIMIEGNIPNVEAAAALWEKKNPKPVVLAGANYESDSWNLRGDPKDDNLKALFENEDAWSDREAAMAINTFRQTNGAGAAA